MDNNELYHYGILGMKWGVRRTPSQLGHKTSGSDGLSGEGNKKSSEKSSSQTSKSSSTSQRKSVKDMTDEELSQALRRLELEKRYKELTPKEISKGKAFAEHVAKKMVLPAVEDAGKQLIKSGITKMLNDGLKLEGDYKIATNNKKK